MDWRNIVKLENGAIKVPSRWLHLHYYEALNILFRVENSLRMLVYVALKNQYKNQWGQTSLSSDDGDTSISAIARKRKSQAATFGYLGYPVTSPLMYLTTGELTRIIEQNWDIFRPYFVGGQEIVSMKLAEIISVRNAFAHFRPIKSDDVETIKQVSKHVLGPAEIALAEMLSCYTTVPTNTDEKWYAELKLINSEHVKLKFVQSSDEKWVTITLEYSPPVTDKGTYSGTRFFDAMKLHTPAILLEYIQLASNLTYATEFSYGFVEPQSKKDRCEKIINLCFYRKTLQDNYAVVQSEITALLSKIEEETELIKVDNLARGKLISSVSLSGKVEAWVLHDTTAMDSGLREDDPAEWWGNMRLFKTDIISATHTFPWMPTDIAGMQGVGPGE